MKTRRDFLQAAGSALVGATLVNPAAIGAVPEAPLQTTPAMQRPREPSTARPFHTVVTLNGWSLPWRMSGEWKEFHLVAEPVKRQLAPGMTANLWGYNGQSPGPTIECVEGDK